jgi:hypothetical protein
MGPSLISNMMESTVMCQGHVGELYKCKASMLVANGCHPTF